MKNTITLLILGLVLVSCNSVKRSQKFLNSGNYDQAIFLVAKKLQKGNDNSRRDDQIVILEEAFKRVANEDQKRIKFLQKSNTNKAIREIYYTHLDLSQRQALIEPLLPLFIDGEDRNARFDFKDYDNEILAARTDYIESLYAEGNIYMDRQTTADYRTAYNIFCELDKLDSNYKDVDELRNDARFLGTTFVFVTLRNRSGQIIPRRLERELLDFNTYNLDNFWTEYHSEKQSDIDYNYGIVFNFRDILISPEQISENTHRRNKVIKDEREDLERNSESSQDTTGVSKAKAKDLVVRASVTYTTQTKNVLVGGTVLYRDLFQNRDIDRHPLSAEFIFENTFTRFRGDERALTEEDLLYLDNEFLPFPSNEQMVLDAGQEIKNQLSSILKNNSF